MNKNIIQEFSEKVEKVRQQTEDDFKTRVDEECQRIDNQPVSSTNLSEFKESCFERLHSEADNPFQKVILKSLGKRKLKLKNSYFVQDNHLISMIDKESMPTEFNASTRDYILLPKSIPATLLSKLKFRYCLIPFVSIVLAAVLFWAMPLVKAFLAK